MNEIENILFLFFAGSDYRPDTLAPAHSGIAAGTLCDPAVNDGMTNLPFGTIISRLNVRFRQETKICFRRTALESPSQFLSKFMVRRLPHFAQKSSLDPFHTPCKAGLGQFITAMQRSEHFLEPIQQILAPAGKFIIGMLGKKA